MPQENTPQNKGQEQTVKENNLQATYPMMNAGVAMPYVAFFDNLAMPIYNPHSQRPLGTSLTSFNFKYEVDKFAECNMDIHVGHYSVVDLPSIQKGSIIYLQWGYIYPEGRTRSSKPKQLKIKSVSYTFDHTGTRIQIKAEDQSKETLTYLPQFIESDTSMGDIIDYMDRGFGKGVGICIRKFNHNKFTEDDRAQ